MLLWKKVAEESATRCGTSTKRDIETCRARYEHEGFSFYTITLPEFGKAFQQSLDSGRWVSPSDHSSFSYDRALPRFMGGLLEQVFDRSTGELLESPSIDAILAVRQLTLMFGKILLPCTRARDRKAMQGYIECEQDVRVGDAGRSAIDLADFRRVSNTLFWKMLKRVDRKVYNYELFPKHGPGATADRLRGNAKYRVDSYPARLNEAFPIVEYLIPNYSFVSDLEAIDILEPGSEIPAKVITVPKTLKTPRIIAMEPTAMQFAQQALRRELYEAVENNPVLNRLIGFRHQEPNQRLARMGSLTGKLATLDLSEASDRVSNQLVNEMFKSFPHLHNAVMASRSETADVPGHGVQHLAKFASMGSALCFPVEAMVFLTLVFLGIERELNSPVTERMVVSHSRRVRIYGDDIIVPTDCVESVVSTLQAFGAVVGINKSFWTGKFRESCGKEYYDGHDVSIVKVRREFPTQRRHVAEVISLVETRNLFYLAGYWETCKWLDDVIRGVLKHYPVVTDRCSALGRFSFLGFDKDSCRWNDQLHRHEVLAYVVCAKLPRDPLDGYGALLKCFLKSELGEQSEDDHSLYREWHHLMFPASADGEHLERAGRPMAVRIKPKWVTPY